MYIQKYYYYSIPSNIQITNTTKYAAVSGPLNQADLLTLSTTRMSLERLHLHFMLVFVQSINQSIKSSQSRTRAQSHTRARRSPSQHHLKGSKPRVAKRRRLGGLKAPTRLCAILGLSPQRKLQDRSSVFEY